MSQRTFDRIADLPVRIDGYELSGRERPFSPEFSRLTTTIHLHGGGETGLGEDVGYDEAGQRAHRAAGAVHDLSGEWTIASLSEHLEQVDLWLGADPRYPAEQQYRRWAFESAALDLGLRQAGTSLHEALGREARPLRFVTSIRLGEPPDPAGVLERIEAYGDSVRFKLDAEPSWDDDLLDVLAATGAVDVLDLKGAYVDTPVDVETDPDLYRRVAEKFPDAWIEDPDLGVPEAAEALRPYRDRITWDAPIHSVGDVQALPFAPTALNSKPSRFGPISVLFDFYDFCAQAGIELYGGGQSELHVGRGQIQYLASIFHPDGGNDVAPPGWDQADWPRTGLPTSPLDPDPEPAGFRRRGTA